MKMNEATVTQVVRRKIIDGRLPRDRVGAVSATYGADEVCDACAASVAPGQILYTLSRAGAGGFAFHRECFGIWRDERNRIVSAGPGVLD